VVLYNDRWRQLQGDDAVARTVRGVAVVVAAAAVVLGLEEGR